MDHLFSALSFPLGEHWKITNAQADDLADAIVETQEIIPSAVFSGVDKASGPLHLASAFGSVIIPRVIMTQARSALSQQQKQAEAQAKAREKTMGNAGFGGASVDPFSGRESAYAQPPPHQDITAPTNGHVDPTMIVHGMPAVEIDESGHPTIRIPTIGVTE